MWKEFFITSIGPPQFLKKERLLTFIEIPFI